MSNVPYAIIQRAIPVAERRRVWLRKFGAGTTFDRLTLGGMTTGYGVLLDNGERVTCAPAELSYDVPPLPLASNVVPFRRPGAER